jgi:hypothetical protein
MSKKSPPTEIPLRIVLIAPPPHVDFGVQEGKGSDYETVQKQRSTGAELRFGPKSKGTLCWGSALSARKEKAHAEALRHREWREAGCARGAPARANHFTLGGDNSSRQKGIGRALKPFRRPVSPLRGLKNRRWGAGEVGVLAVKSTLHRRGGGGGEM